MTQRNAAFLEHRSDADRKLLFASVAAPPEVSLTLTRLRILHLVHAQIAAARTGRMLTPTLFFHELDRCFFIGACLWQIDEDRIVLRGAVLYFGLRRLHE